MIVEEKIKRVYDYLDCCKEFVMRSDLKASLALDTIGKTEHGILIGSLHGNFFDYHIVVYF